MTIIYPVVLILILDTLLLACRALPLDLTNTLEQDVLQPVVTSACSPSGRCWGWLPIQDDQENDAIVPDNVAMSRLHTRQIPSLTGRAMIEPWTESVSPLDTTQQSSSSPNRQSESRMTKKDLFVSRSWGAGGMPFSVLYMSPHATRSNHAGTASPHTARKTVESSKPPLTQPNYRIALRNGATGQPRRQYSIIPQLFISYGWGPLGK